MSSPADATNAFEAALVTALAAAGITAHRHPAPVDAPLPVVTFNKYDENESRTLGGNLLAWVELLYMVRAIDTGGSVKAARELLAAVDGALDGADLAVTGWGLMLLARDGGREYDEPAGNVGGELYHHVIGLYRVRLTP